MEVEHTNREEPVRAENTERTGSLCDRKALVVGLTGGIATGKSTVARMFEELGATVLSADEIVHRLLEPGTDVWRRIVDVFGEGILCPDQSIDRRMLAKIVFDDIEKRMILEAITHPPVIQYLAQEADKFRRSGKGILILEVPLLIETSSSNIADKIIVVTAEQNTQIERLYNRYGIDRKEAVARIKSQLPQKEKIKYADWVVSTEGTMANTREHVYRVWAALQNSLAQC